MRRTILSEDERSRILNLHKKAILVENPVNIQSKIEAATAPWEKEQYKKMLEDLKSITSSGDTPTILNNLKNFLDIMKANNSKVMKDLIPYVEQLKTKIENSMNSDGLPSQTMPEVVVKLKADKN